MSIIVQHISYIHPNRQFLFSNINFTINKARKVALVGNNGSGKSTLLRIIAGMLEASAGKVICDSKPYYVPQHFGQYNEFTIAGALNISYKVKALQAILAGDAAIENFNCLNDDWDIEERALAALQAWDISYLSLWQSMDTLSGGEKTKVFLAGINIHSPEIILFDEPSNHLDKNSRKQLYNLIETSNATVLVVSHDRTLLNTLDTTYELSQNGVTQYGGNFDFYKQQRDEALNAIQEQIDDKNKKLRLARKTAREVEERKQKQDAKGKKKSEKEGVARILMKTLKNRAEESSSKLKDKHTEKIEAISNDLKEIRDKMPDNNELKLNLGNPLLHKGKILVTAKAINFKYTDENLWDNALDFQIISGDRFIINGNNGSGKSTLLNIVSGRLDPTEGVINRAEFNYVYVDQEYSMIDNKLTIFEQVERYNSRNLLEHELKTLLHRFLFSKDTWDKTCDMLSGGEKMKLVFCCLMVSNKTPDVLALDEPTNNLDIQSMDIITSAVKNYQGTILLISHDRYFANDIGVDKQINM